jgi:hypothetical protein
LEVGGGGLTRSPALKSSKSAQAWSRHESIFVGKLRNRAPLAWKKHDFFVMSAPVVDHARRAVIQEITSKSPFNVFNIVAIVAILVIGYFMYKKFNEKFEKGSIKIPHISPLEPKTRSVAPVVVETMPDDPEVIEEADVKEE